MVDGLNIVRGWFKNVFQGLKQLMLRNSKLIIENTFFFNKIWQLNNSLLSFLGLLEHFLVTHNFHLLFINNYITAIF